MDSKYNDRMKRELVGLVVGVALLVSGSVFLFSQFMWQGDSVAASLPETPEQSPAQTPPARTASLQDKPLAGTENPTTTLPRTTTPITPPEPEAATPEPVMVASLSPEITTDTSEVTETLPETNVETALTTEATETLPETDIETALTTEVTETSPETAVETMLTTADFENTGWIYGGQFVNGKWLEQGLKTGDELPEAGKRYATTWGATVRDNPPGARYNNGSKMGSPIDYFTAGREVSVLQVKQSGTKGHIWLEVGW